MKDIFSFLCAIAAASGTLYCLFIWLSNKRVSKRPQSLRNDIERMVFSRNKYVAEAAVKKYYIDHEEGLKHIQQEVPKRSAINLILFAIHTHGELCKDDEIVYREADIIELFKILGYETNWGDE